MAFPGGPLPSSIPDRRIDSLPPETSPVGGTSYRGTVEEGVYLFVVCYFGRRMELSFPETVLNSLHTCGASSSLCMVAFRLLRASALLEPVSVPPTWVAGDSSSATEVSPEIAPAGHRDGSTWGRDATGPEIAPTPR